MFTDNNSFILRPMEAFFFENHNFIFRQDPYVLITIGDKKFKTKVDKSAGLHPHWSEQFNIEGLNNALAVIQVYDRDTLVPDYLLGEAIFSLNNRFFGESSEQKLDLFKNDKRVGWITLQFQPFTGFDQNVQKANITEAVKDKSFIQTVKEDINIIGQKITQFEKKIEGALGFGHTQNVELPVEARSCPDCNKDFKTTEPVSQPLGDTSLPQTKTLDKNNTEFFGQEPSFSTQDQSFAKPGVLDKSNTEFFGENDTQIVQGQEFNKFAPLEDKHDIGESKLGSDHGLSEQLRDTTLGVTQKDFNVSDYTNTKNLTNAGVINQDLDKVGYSDSSVDNSDKWSVISNQGSVADKSELPIDSAEHKNFLEQSKIKARQFSQDTRTKLGTVGDTLMTDFQKKKEQAHETYVNMENQMGKWTDQISTAINQGEDRIKQSAQQIGETLKSTFSRDKPVTVTSESHTDYKDKAVSQPGLLEKGKQKLHEISEDITNVFTDRSHIKPEDPVDKPIDLKTISENPIHYPGKTTFYDREPSIVEKSKEDVDDFSSRAIDVLEKPLRSPSADQAGPIEGPKDIDIVDVGPQDFNIDKKFNNDHTLDKRSAVENEAIIERSNELQKEGIFDRGFESKKLTQKAQELQQQGGFLDKSVDLPKEATFEDQNVDFTKPTLTFDNKDTKTQFMGSNIGLHTDKAAQLDLTDKDPLA